MTIQIKDLTIAQEIDLNAVRGGLGSANPIAFRAGLNSEPAVTFNSAPALSDFNITKTIDKSSPHLFA